MGKLRIVLSAVRGVGTVGVAAAGRIGVDPRGPHATRREAGRQATPPGGAVGLAALFPSQSESAAVLDAYLGGLHWDNRATSHERSRRDTPRR